MVNLVGTSLLSPDGRMVPTMVYMFLRLLLQENALFRYCWISVQLFTLETTVSWSWRSGWASLGGFLLIGVLKVFPITAGLDRIFPGSFVSVPKRSSQARPKRLIWHQFCVTGSPSNSEFNSRLLWSLVELCMVRSHLFRLACVISNLIIFLFIGKICAKTHRKHAWNPS